MSYIKLVTEIPNKRDAEDYKQFDKYEARSMHGQLPVLWDWAKDFIVGDRWGNKFIDFTSGICVANSGHGNKNIINGLKTLLDKSLLHTYTFPSDIRYWFLRELVETCYPGGKAFLVSAGTEATEVAIKLMRMYGFKQHNKKNIVLSFSGAMHGRTMVAEKLRGETKDNSWAEPWDSTFIKLPFPTEKDTFKELLSKYCKENLYNICGIMIESYQGWSASFYSSSFIKEIYELAKKYNWIICFDEIQSGFGRTGKMFAWEHYNIPTPDLICCGKGISSSLPLSAVIGRKDILDIPEVGSMSSTHSANPMSCMAGLKNLLEFKRLNLVKEANKKEKIFKKYLNNKKYKIQGKGMVWAIITKTDQEATDIVWKCFKKGLLTIWTHRNSVKIAPPLTIKEDALIEGLKIIKEILDGNEK